MTELGRLTARHLCAGVVVRDGVVIATAPILHYMLRWSKAEVEDYVRQREKHWRLEWREEKAK